MTDHDGSGSEVITVRVSVRHHALLRALSQTDLYMSNASDVASQFVLDGLRRAFQRETAETAWAAVIRERLRVWATTDD